MNKTDRNSLIVFPFLVLIGFLFALAGSQGGVLWQEYPYSG